jgi:hypothetical protein
MIPPVPEVLQAIEKTAGRQSVMSNRHDGITA